jgi:O-antigen/teichoic acid export membrane protein
MVYILKMISLITNDIHDVLIKIFKSAGYNMTDKQLHYLIIGVIGIIIFLLTNLVFKYLAKYSISAISFIYTFTVMVVFVFAIEIEQKLTGRGKMEFEDITAGLWGFIEFFAAYLAIKLVVYLVKKLYTRLTSKSQSRTHNIFKK